MTKWAAVSAAAALAASTDKTLIRVKAGSSNPIKLVELGVSFDGTDTTDKPFEVKVLKQSSDGTGDAVTPKKMTGTSSASVQASAADNFSAEPTDSDILWHGYLTPAGGRWPIQIPDEDTDIAAGERIAIRVVAPSGITTVNAIGYIHFKE